MRSDCLAKERIGTIGKNKYESLMKIIEYKGTDNVWVKFENDKVVHTTWQAFLKGNVRNPFDRTVYGVGFIGEGEYKPSNNRKDTRQYKTWSSMIKRCYNERYIEKNHTYKGCSVAEEWHNFQNFAKWYDENYYEIEGEVMCLDKDILVKGNKIYSPETCVFVPHSINTLFIKNEAKRNDMPIGGYLRKNKKEHTYISKCGDGKGSEVHLGQYSTIEKAFEEYKKYKENLIKELAVNNKDKIQGKLYNAMMNYVVDIND